VRKNRPVRRLALWSSSVVVLATLGACTSTHTAASPAGTRTTTTTSAAGPATTLATGGSGPTTTTAPASSGWTTYGGGFTRTSAVAAPAFTHTPVEAWTSPSLDGPVYGQPLFYDGQVLVATENDTVYGLDAANGTVSWSVHLGTPVPSGDLPCGDISPTVGITSTMVVDPASGMVFASGSVESKGAVHHVLAAISTTGHDVTWTVDLDQPGWSAPAQLQRTGLAIAGGRVLVGFGGNYGDCGRYNGWAVGVPESGTGTPVTYRVPTANEGAIWAPAGITVDAGGTVYVATGNGSAQPGQPFDHGDAVIALGPDLTELGYFAPADWAQDNTEDLDLGSTAPIALGDGRLFMVGKQAVAYLLQADALGGIGHPLSSIGVCNSRGANAYEAGSAFVVCSDDGTVDQVVIGPGNTMARGWTWRSPTGGRARRRSPAGWSGRSTRRRPSSTASTRPEDRLASRCPSTPAPPPTSPP